MGMNVLKEHSWFIFTRHQVMEALCPAQNLGTHQTDYMSPYNLES